MSLAFPSNRARDGTRTRDPDLGKVVLHQLSHSRTSYYFSSNAQNRNRTSDTRIFSPLLYQLSYLGGYHRKSKPAQINMPATGIEPVREVSPAGF